MPLPAPEPITLRDGTSLTLRPIRPDDAPRLQAFHTRLSPESIYLRYMGAHPVLSDAEARKLTNLDYQAQMAFVATVQPEPEGEEMIVGVARYIALGPKRPDEAEVAIVIEDRYQNRGLGTLLLQRLGTYARPHGMCAFVAEISAENDRMMRFVRHTGLPMEKSFRDGVWEVRLNIA